MHLFSIFRGFSLRSGLGQVVGCLVGLVAMGPVASTHAAPSVVTAAAEPNIFRIANQWFAEAKGCENIKDFTRGDASRGVVDAVLTCQALKLGGYKGEYKLVKAPNPTRALAMATSGEVTMPSESVWAEDLDHKLYYSVDPLLGNGDNFRALFVRADKVNSYSVKTVADLRKLKAVVPSNWVKDWTALTDIGIKPEDVSTVDGMLRMIAAGRADYTLLGFNSNPNFLLESEGVQFVPLPGIKLAIHGEMRLSIRRTAPDALEIYNALNKGVKILRANGTISRAWRESGFFNKRAEGWTVLN